MPQVKVEKYRGSEFKVMVKQDDGWRLKAKHMAKDEAEKFAKVLNPNWKKAHKKGSIEPKKKDVKAAKKPVRRSLKRVK